ncbi:MAG TPA: GNAT family N-acetyltransferase [Solirubrobacterales bacterium]|jgi:CelD/BcsL family acetyltransferase involved in cellulose biosynthesis
MTLAVEWVEDIDAFAALGPEWEAMLPPDARPFDLHEWYSIWWGAFGAELQLALCTARRDGELVGVFPLARDGGRLVGLVNGHTGVFRPLARDPGALEALAAAALDAGTGEIELRLLAPDDPGRRQLEALAGAAGRRCLAEPGFVSPIVETGGELEDWRKGKNKSWKSRIARYGRKLQRDHDAQLSIVVAPDDLDAWLQEGFEIEAGGWKGEEGTAILSSPETEAFYGELARRFERRGELRLNRIAVDGKAIAFSLCLLGGDRRLYSLKAGFDESWKKQVPGLILQLEIVERCFELGLDAYELLGESSDWKGKVATAERAHVDLRIFPRGPVGALRYLYRAKLRPRVKRAYRRLRPRRR